MSTRNFVPRADNEGSIGTAAKRWNSVNAVDINANSISASSMSGDITGRIVSDVKYDDSGNVLITKADGTTSSFHISSGGTGGETGGVELADVTDASATAGNGKILLKWTDPDDLVYQGSTLAAWLGTKVVRKEGSAPESVSDGTLIVNSIEHNQYSSTALVDDNLTNGTKYYYRFFPYTTKGIYTSGTSVYAVPSLKPFPNLTVSSNSEEIVEGGTASVSVSTNGAGELSVSTSDSAVATAEISGGTVTITAKSTGSATIIVSQAESTSFAAYFAEIKITVPEISYTLNGNSWAQISKVARSGLGDAYWDIGDCKEILLNGTIGNSDLGSLTFSNQEICVFILDFNHAENGIADNNIIFGGFKSALINGVDIALQGFKMNNQNYNYGGWKGSDLRYGVLGATSAAPSNYVSSKTTSCTGYDATDETLASPKSDTLLAALPEELRNNMRLWNRYIDAVGNSSNVDANIKKTVDAISLLCESEIFSSRSYANQYESNHNTRMAYYTNGNSTIRYKHSDHAAAVWWWGASPNYHHASTFCRVNTSGGAGNNYASYSGAVAPAFKI